FLALTIVVSVGAAFAQSAGGQNDKEKSKAQDQLNKKDDASTRMEFVPAQEFSLPLNLGEGGYLGVYLEEVTPDRVKDLNLTEERGAIIMKVVQGSPAEKAGLKENDVIVSFNGRRVESVRELQRLLSETPANRNVSVEVIRGGNHQTLSATLSKRSNYY